MKGRGHALRTPLLVSALALGLSACALLVPPPAPELYDLTIGASIETVDGGTRGQILIQEPKVLSSLDTDRIVIRPTPSQITFFRGVRWSDRLPRLVQLYFSRAFTKTEGARAVGLPGDGLVIDHQLLFDLRAFQVEQSGSSFTAQVEIAVRILNDRNGRVVATRSFSVERPTSDDPVAAVNALNEALDEVAVEIIAWVYSAV